MDIIEISITNLDVCFLMEWTFKEYPIAGDSISAYALTEQDQQKIAQRPLPSLASEWSRNYKNLYDLILDVGLVVKSRSWTDGRLIVFCTCDR